MPANTPALAIPYPLPSDAVTDYPGVGQDLAETVEAEVVKRADKTSSSTQEFAGPISIGQRVVDPDSRLTLGKTAAASSLQNLPWLQCGISTGTDNDLILCMSASSGAIRFYGGNPGTQNDQPGTGSNRELGRFSMSGATLQVKGDISTGPANTNDKTVVGLYLGGPGANGYIQTIAAAYNSGALFCAVAAESQWRFTIDHQGLLSWGPGGAVSLDTQMRRSAVNTLDLYNGAWGTYRAAAFAVQSDRDAKADIRALPAEEDRVLVEGLLAAPVYTFKRKGAGEERHLGVMTDELPEHVVLEGTYNPDPNESEGDVPTSFVDLYKFATGLLAVSQHLAERVAALEAAAAAKG